MKWKGFTLIELLIVISILGILSTAVLIAINPIAQIQKGHDFKRKSDISSMQTALEQYRNDLSGYPVVTSAPYILGSCGSQFTSGGIVYMNKIPCDPVAATKYNAISSVGNYYYWSNGATYILAACLETAADTDGTTTAPTPAASGACTTYYVVTNQ